MQKPIFFEHEIVNPDNMDFLTTSVENTVNDNVAVFTNGEPGIARGLNITGAFGSSQYSITQGFGYTAAGQRIELFNTMSGIQILSGGTYPIYLKLLTQNYDPQLGPTSTVTQINPDDGSYNAVQQFDSAIVAYTSGTDTIKVGTLTADIATLTFISADNTAAEQLKIGGIFSIPTMTIDGSMIQSGTMDSISLKNPLTKDINLGTGVNILLSGSNNIGSLAIPLENIYSNTGTFHAINGMSPILIDSLQLNTGESIESESGLLKIDASGNGVSFGSLIYTTEIDAGLLSGNMLLYTPKGDIEITTASGNINLLSSGGSINVQSDMVIGGNTTLNGSLAGSNFSFTSSGLAITDNSFSTKNLIFNSDFAMGIPTYYSGATSFTGSGVSNFKSGLTIFSPWEARYTGTLAPYNWTLSGNNSSYKVILGTSEYAPETVGINEVQTITNTATAPTGGSFWLTYTGIPAAVWPTGSYTTGTAFFNYDVEATGIQTALEAFSNIGINNISVSGNVVSGIRIEFINSLGFKNLPTITISGSGIWQGGGLQAWSTSVVNGYTPVDPSVIYKDPSVYYQTPGQGTFARVIGTGISSTGVTFGTEISSAKPGKDYNVSLYYKPIISGTYLNLQAGIFDSPYGSGLGVNGSFVSLPKIDPYTDWQRINTNLVSPSTVSGNLYLVFRAQESGTTAGINPIFDIAAVQLTEGQNLFAYNNNSQSIFKMIEPSGMYNPSAWKMTPSNLTNSYDRQAIRTSISAYGSPGPIYNPTIILSGSFYSPGCMCQISYDATFNDYNVVDGTSVHSILLDGKLVKNCFICLHNTNWESINMVYSGYLSRGIHSVQQLLSPTAGECGAHYPVGFQRTSNAITSDGWYPAMPSLNITLFN